MPNQRLKVEYMIEGDPDYGNLLLVRWWCGPEGHPVEKRDHRFFCAGSLPNIHEAIDKIEEHFQSNFRTRTRRTIIIHDYGLGG